MVVTVLPSPNGVGLTLVTRTSLPFPPDLACFTLFPGNFGYVGAVESEVLPLDADCLSNLLNREQFRTSGYLKIGIHRATHGKPHLKPSSGNMRWDVQ